MKQTVQTFTQQHDKKERKERKTEESKDTFNGRCPGKEVINATGVKKQGLGNKVWEK